MNIRLQEFLQFVCRGIIGKKTGWRSLWVAGCFSLLSPFGAMAQETVSTLPYAHRLFLNPAFTGLLSDYSITAGYRSQWTGVNNGFSTQWASGEYRFQENKNALGATFLADKAPTGGYQKIQAGLLYAYHTKLREKLDLSAGMQVGYGSQKPSTNGLVFEDQLNSNGTISGPTAETFGLDKTSYLTLSGGLLLFTPQFWLGVSGHHVNNPQVGEMAASTVGPTFQMQTGYRFYVRSHFDRDHFEEISFIPTLSYTHQRSFNRLDASVYANITPVTVGLGLAFLPGAKNTSFTSTFQGLVGVTHTEFKIGYGYRHPLAASPISLGPTHELVLSFEKVDYLKIFKRSGSDKKYNRIACPAF
ncbi:PorP/SprF family type IX secretion system membrane protein [Rufibacter latericius]|uniref:Type IX secretion system membrane protein PorP/SprF n=1 Tax=Rufibacter latericius TaxID=2487040 RepID=A0A3M9MQ51_9BACT|nr:PorP/SprF family type IX secretion system membrane protein [Rufibacter latericius]RNI27003.1 type IX secretion system membrane protein PorP/SprF [Rufibacter latericius]